MCKCKNEKERVKKNSTRINEEKKQKKRKTTPKYQEKLLKCACTKKK